MNLKNNQISCQPFCLIVLLFLSRSLIFPFYERQVISAQVSFFEDIAYFILCFLVVCICVPIRNNFDSCAARLLLTAALSVSFSKQLIESYKFYTYYIDQRLAAGVFSALIIISSIYCIHSELAAQSRCAVFVFILVMLSVSLLIFSVSSQIHFVNLQYEMKQEVPLFEYTRKGLYFPVELIFFPLLIAPSKTRKEAAVSFSFLLLFELGKNILCEAVLGPDYGNLAYPLQSISKLGQLSVFSGIDIICVFVWLQSSFFTCGFYAALISLTFEAGKSGKNKLKAAAYLIFAIPVFVFWVWKEPQGAKFLSQCCMLFSIGIAYTSKKLKKGEKA